MAKRILVTGKNGQLGQSLQKVVRDFSRYLNTTTYDLDLECYTNESDFVFVSRDELDLSSKDSIINFFKNQKFTGIINCAAYTSVDKAETDEKLADQINHHAVAQLAKIARNQSIPLIHISTDYVFHGQPYKLQVETDQTKPQNIYGLTKLKGEEVLKISGCKGAIIRTSWLHSEFGNNFVKTMLSLSKELDSIKVVSDQVGSPTYATNLAKVLLLMLNKRSTIEILNSQLNTYHFSDDGFCSWYDFAKAIFELSNISCEVNPVVTKDYTSQAKRPKYNVMSKEKIKYLIPSLIIPHWRESLVSCLVELKNRDN